MVDVEREKRLQFLWSAAHHYVSKTPALSASLMYQICISLLPSCYSFDFPPQELFRSVIGHEFRRHVTSQYVVFLKSFVVFVAL